MRNIYCVEPGISCNFRYAAVYFRTLRTQPRNLCAVDIISGFQFRTLTRLPVSGHQHLIGAALRNFRRRFFRRFPLQALSSALSYKSPYKTSAEPIPRVLLPLFQLLALPEHCCSTAGCIFHPDASKLALRNTLTFFSLNASERVFAPSSGPVSGTSPSAPFFPLLGAYRRNLIFLGFRFDAGFV